MRYKQDSIIMADNFGGSENIYYEENSNIVLIDPNSVKDSNGNKKNRTIKQENLVMYANLIAKSVPRTKLAVGQDLESSVNNTTIASINFLKPTDKNVFDTSYTDEITGAGSTQGRGINQIKFNQGQNPQQTNFVDTQVLGIRDINVDIKFNGVPTVTMTLVDVQGKSLFQTGGNSPYSVFLYYPYPLFELVLKGFYGKAIKYELMLLNFQASFEASTGNYIVNLKFIARTSAMLDDVRLGYLFALPHMYNQYSIPNTPTVNTPNSATASVQQNGTGITNEVTVEPTSKGYSKIKQVFEEYKRKGLIDKNVPVLTLNEMSIRLTKYTEFLNKEFEKLDFTNIVALERYKESLNKFSNKIVQWGETNLDSNKVLVLNNEFKVGFSSENSFKLYPLRNLSNSLSGATLQSNVDLSGKVETELTSILQTGLKEFNSVPTDLCKSIALDQKAFKVDFFKVKFSDSDINYQDTYFKQRGKQVTNPNTDVDFIKFKKDLKTELENNGTLLSVNEQGNIDITKGNLYYYTLDREVSTIQNINGQIVQKYKEESERLNQVLKAKLRTNDNVQDLQFRPTVRNVIGAIMASVDAFYQLMDDVHTNAWNQRDNTARLKSILTTNPSQEGKNIIQTTTTQNSNYFVYPWPQFVQKKETSGKVEYEITYPGSKSTSESTQAYNPVIWPEVEFVEEYLKGVLEKDRNFTTDVKPNTGLVVKYTPEHAIEIPFRTNVYNQQNNSVQNYVYEMYERLYLNTFYSGLYYLSGITQDLVYTASDLEVNNVVQSQPTGVLKNIISNNLPTTTLYDYLKTTAGENQAGPLWNTFISQNFVTPYINDQVNDSWKILSPKDFDTTSSNPLKLKSLDNIKTAISSNTTNETTLFDTYPFIIDSFAQKMQGTPNKDNRYSTVNSYGFNDKKLVIDNFSGPNITPLTRNQTSTIGYTETQTTHQSINNFYNNRYENKLQKFYTEGNVTYTTDNNVTYTQTTSLLNTPYFINAIVESGDSTGDEKYTKLGYLLLNSLPLSTLHEKYIDSANGTSTDYIFANLNKFSAIHELPYAWILKMGSVWYRYKKYIENNEDILTSIWKDFDYKTNYDPITSAATKTYNIRYGGNPTERNFTLLGDSIQSGFYPKVINNFYKIFTDTDLFVDSSGTLTYNLNDTTVLFGDTLVVNGNTKYNSKPEGPILSYYSYLNIVQEYSSFFGPQYQDHVCLFPSAGVQPFQQTYYELRPETNLSPITVSDIRNSNPMYNGSVKTLWNAPNYGWFDNSKVQMPTPLEYLKYVRTGTTENQTDFDITSTYSSIEDLFGVFSKDQLDSFETEFKEFCKLNGQSQIFSPEGDNTTYANIVNLFKKMFVIKPESGNKDTDLGAQQAANINDVLSKFVDIKVYLKNGNPKKFNRQQFGYFSKNSQFEPTQPITYQPYTGDTNPLPSVGGKTVQQSKATDPEAWIALQEYVGFSTIEGIEYTQTSTVYDFFRDNQIPFRSDNIKLLYPLIRIYATQKKLNPSYSSTTFANDITTILNVAEKKRTAIEQQFRLKLPPSINGPKQDTIQNVDSKLDGDIIKLEQWELFKAVNDKWVSGRNFKERLLFDEFLFFDKANRDIGDELIINTDTIRKYCNWDNSSNSVMSLVRQIVADNRMNFFVMPAYINFYGKSSLKTTDRNVSILNNANDVFSTFTYVDYIDSAPKFLCQYIDRPSQTLSLENDPNYPFKSDSFDLGNPTNNPIVEKGNVNQHKNNKAVGFVVDFGTINQSVFKSVDINQEQGVTSSEQIQTTIDMGNQGSGKKTMQQTTSLYDFYKNRSYSSTVKTLGNVMIQPTMYFVLRHMPMFNGTYIIRNVKHSISPGNFNTEFNGQRVSANINTKVSDDLASVNEDFSKKLSDKVKQFVTNNTLVTYDSNSQQYLTGDKSKEYVLSGRTPYQGFIVQTKDITTQDCGENINAVYGVIENSNFITSSITVNELVTIINSSTTDTLLRTYMFSALYLMGNTTDKTTRLKYNQNNLYGVTVDIQPPGATASLITKYRCLTTGENIVRPFATFDSVQDGVNFIRDIYKGKIQSYFNEAKTDEQKINAIIKLFYDTWYTSGTLTKSYNEHQNYNTWLGNARWAYNQAKILKLY
jgi:hypothetical protein